MSALKIGTNQHSLPQPTHEGGHNPKRPISSIEFSIL